MRKEQLEAIATDLRAGRAVELSVEDFPCFSETAAEADGRTSPETLARISEALTHKKQTHFLHQGNTGITQNLSYIGG